ncbi:hypothetical protein HDU98_010133 [Podochytrium sp. JEL0797]|nr:hypothetical protein HDU98_010133 [Podochytrium sp. JEL0797]
MRTQRHNLKLNLAHKTRFARDTAFDEQLLSMLVAFETADHDASTNNQRLVAAQRSVSGLPSAKWTVWVDAALKDRFHAAKLASCPAGSTHSVFTEMLLNLRDELHPAAHPGPVPAPHPKKQPFIQKMQHIAHSMFTPSSTSRSLFASSRSPFSSESTANALNPPLNVSRPKFSVFNPRMQSTDTNSTAKTLEADYSIFHGSPHDSKSKQEDSSLSSIELYSDSDASSLSPKYDHEVDEKAERASVTMQSDPFPDERKMNVDSTFQETPNPLPYHSFYFPGQTLAFQQLQLQQQQQQQQLNLNPPRYGDTKIPSFEPLPSLDTKKMQLEYLFDPLDPSTGSFWDQDANPSFLEEMYTAAEAVGNARKKSQELDDLAFVVSSSSGQKQQEPPQQPPSSNEPLPPYLGIMSPLSTPLAALTLCAEPVFPAIVLQPSQQQAPLDLEPDVFDTYLNAMVDSPDLAPTVVAMEDVDMWSLGGGGDGAGSPVFADAALVLPPPAYDGVDVKEDDGISMELGMELEMFVALNGF